VITDSYAICTTLVITESLPYCAISNWRAMSEFLANMATSIEFEYNSFLTLTLAWYTWNPGATDSFRLYCEPCDLFPYGIINLVSRFIFVFFSNRTTCDPGLARACACALEM